MIFYLIFGTMIDSWNVYKLTELSFPGKLSFAWTQNKIFWISFSWK